jgi:membrane-associated phospholipid phosphatase
LGSTGPDGAVLPLPRRLTATQWVRLVVIWAALLVAFVLLLRFDVALMRWRYMVIPGKPGGMLRQVLDGLRDFAQFVPITVAIIIVWLTDRRRVLFVRTLLIALLLVLAISQPVKWCFPRYRPETAMTEVADPRFLLQTRAGASGWGGDSDRGEVFARLLEQIEPGDTWMRWADVPFFRPAKYQSFPSGHSCAAFAFAAVLVWFYPHLRWVFWTLAFGCAASRAVDAVHWASDCLAGAAFGYAAAWMALRPYAWALPADLVRRLTRHHRAVK